MDLDDAELLRRHAEVVKKALAEARVKGYTRRSKTGKAVMVHDFERGDRVKFGNRRGVVTNSNKTHAYVAHSGGSTLVHKGNLKRTKSESKSKELAGFLGANNLHGSIYDRRKEQWAARDAKRLAKLHAGIAKLKKKKYKGKKDPAHYT